MPFLPAAAATRRPTAPPSHVRADRWDSPGGGPGSVQAGSGPCNSYVLLTSRWTPWLRFSILQRATAHSSPRPYGAASKQASIHASRPRCRFCFAKPLGGRHQSGFSCCRRAVCHCWDATQHDGLPSQFLQAAAYDTGGSQPSGSQSQASQAQARL